MEENQNPPEEVHDLLDLSDFDPDEKNVEESIVFMYKMALLHTSYGNYGTAKAPPVVRTEKESNNVIAYFQAVVQSKQTRQKLNHWLKREETIEVSNVLLHLPYYYFNIVAHHVLFFLPFHLLMCTAISSVLESYEASDNPFTLNNRELLIWKKCNFKVSEIWEEVKNALQPYVAQINQYIRFLMVIPGMKSFFKVIGSKDNIRYILCTQMSIETFMKYNLDIFCHYDLDVDVCGYTAHSLATGCSRCEDNYNMLSSEKIHSKNCSYYNKILPNNSAIAQVRDKKAMEKELLQGSVVHKYKTVIDRAEHGERYVVKPPPTMKKGPFILLELTIPLNNTLFSAWLNKVEAVNRSVNEMYEYEVFIKFVNSK
jgi:hypothetical protein